MAAPVQAFVKTVNRHGGGQGHVPIYTLGDDHSAFFWQGGMEIDGDGAPNCYHPDGSPPGLDAIQNAMRSPPDPSKGWVGVVTGDNGQPIIQGPDDPFPGFYISPTSLRDPANTDKGDAKRYVDSTAVPFFVLPKPLADFFGVSLGDLGYAMNTRTGKSSPAIFADFGPAMKLGEGSVALANALGIPSSPKNGGTDAAIVRFLVFPGTAATPVWPRPVDEISAAASARFQAFGGADQLGVALPT